MAKVIAKKPKLVKKAEVAKEVVARSKSKLNLNVPSFDLTGKSAGNLSLPESVFGMKVNKSLIAQAVRVYNTNRSTHHGNTKTRGEVRGTTAKMYKQKGTGNARHGAQTAPIFVGGGVAMGPKFRKTILELPKKMKKLALVSVLSQRAQEEQILGVENLKLVTGKTRQMAAFIEKLDRKNILLVVDKKEDSVIRGVRNLKGIVLSSADDLNVFEVVKHQVIAFTKEAVVRLEERLTKEKTKKGEEKND